MTLFNLHNLSPILYDTYGSPFNTPVLLIENLFPSSKSSSSTFPSMLSGEFSVIHAKRIEFSDIEAPEFSLLTATVQSLEEIIMNFPQKVIVVTERKSSALGIQLYLNIPEKIQSHYCLNPEFLFDIKTEKNILKEFWDWFSKREDLLPLLPKLPYILDFYFRYEQFESVVKNEFLNSKGNTHLILTGKMASEPFSHLQNSNHKNNISILESPNNEGSLFDYAILQKILMHFLQKDYLQINKE